MKIVEMKRITILLIMIILNNSCNQSNNILETKNFNDGQKAVSYGENGIIDSIIIEKKGVKVSKFISKIKSKKNETYKVYFYDNKGNIASEGEMNNNHKLGIWYYFKDKEMIKKEEYLSICNKSILNQVWNYKSKEIIDYDKSSFYTFKFKDSILEHKKVEILKVKFNSDKSIKSKRIKFYASSKLKDNFCNVHELDLFDIPKNHKDEYELAFDSFDKFNTIKGFFVEEIKINNEIKEKYTFVRISRKMKGLAR